MCIIPGLSANVESRGVRAVTPLAPSCVLVELSWNASVLAPAPYVFPLFFAHLPLLLPLPLYYLKRLTSTPSHSRRVSCASGWSVQSTYSSHGTTNGVTNTSNVKTVMMDSPALLFSYKIIQGCTNSKITFRPYPSPASAYFLVCSFHGPHRVPQPKTWTTTESYSCICRIPKIDINTLGFLRYSIDVYPL